MFVFSSVIRSDCDVITGAKIANTGSVTMLTIIVNFSPLLDRQPLFHVAFLVLLDTKVGGVHQGDQDAKTSPRYCTA